MVIIYSYFYGGVFGNYFINLYAKNTANKKNIGDLKK